MAVYDPPRPRADSDAGVRANEHLTAITGIALIVLLAALGVTILRIGQLIWLHLFLGLVLLGPVALKLASTGYRFLRYYARSAAYVRRGPPATWLRLLAPVVVVSTLTVFGTGVALLLEGPQHGGLLQLAHKASFIVWLGATGLHVLGHLVELPGAVPRSRGSGAAGHLDAELDPALRSGSDAGRWIVLAGSLVGGLVLAVVLLGHFGAWTAAPGHWHH